jgi:hypothetical protein
MIISVPSWQQHSPKLRFFSHQFWCGCPEDKYPLKIVKVESGSLLIEVLGSAIVVTFLTQCFEKSINYFHRNYTQEGQLASIPAQVEAVKSYLELELLLKENGHDVSTAKESIENASLSIASRLQELTQGQSKIRLNSKEYVIGFAKQVSRLLKGNSQPQLPPGDEPNDNESTVDGEILTDE